MGHPVGRRHQAAAQEGGPAGEEPTGHAGAAHQLDQARGPEQRRGHLAGRSTEEAQDLLEPVTQEEQPEHDPEGAVDRGLEGLEEARHLDPPWLAERPF